MGYVYVKLRFFTWIFLSFHLSLHCYEIWRERGKKHKRLEVQRTPSTFVFEAMYFISSVLFLSLSAAALIQLSFYIICSLSITFFVHLRLNSRSSKNFFNVFLLHLSHLHSLSVDGSILESLRSALSANGTQQHQRKNNINTQCCGLSVFGVLHDCFLW